MLPGGFEHMQMDVRVFVAGEANMSEFACLPRLDQRGVGAVLVENAVRVVIPDNLMVLDQVNAVGLQAAEGFLELLGGRLPAAPVDLGHQENFIAVTFAQRLSQPDFTQPLVIVPGVVHEGDSAVNGAANNAQAQLFIHLFKAEVPSSQPDSGYFLTRA